MIHLVKNKIGNWFLIRLKRLSYGKNYKEHWEERGSRLRTSHDGNVLSEKYAKDTAEYIQSQINSPGNILEYGCGFGKNIKLLEEKLDENCKIFGIDISSSALKEGEKYIHGRAFLKKVNGTKIPFEDDFFNLSFTTAVLEHVPKKDFEKICEELIRVTNKIIIHVEASRTYYTKYPHNYMKFYERKGFPVKSFKLQGFDESFTWYYISLDDEKILTS